ncbi:MAG: type IV toxin-antitoxin system AbiEi family antitoxin domain-containing protein [Planctomycetota bacterium]
MLRETDLRELRDEIYKVDPKQFPRSLSNKKFIEKLVESETLTKVRFDFEGNYRSETRYLFGEPLAIEVALSLVPKAYISHYSAMVLHHLTEQLPKTLYLNAEQAAKPRPAEPLRQEAVDRAFSLPQRDTKRITSYRDRAIKIVSSSYSGNLGVTTTDDGYSVSGLERTLIDCVVRPLYSGGVQEVAKAFKEASTRLAAENLAAMLAELNFMYPYHQVIGFYLQYSGVYSDHEIEIFKSMPMNIDFYLAHNMPNAVYISEWKLFVPQGMSLSE